MISLYSGTPGSGKSLHAAEVVYYRLKLGKPVLTNYPLNISCVKPYGRRVCQHVEVRNYFYEKGKSVNPWDYDSETNTYALTPEFLMAFSRKYFGERRVREGEILLLIDEAQILFNARSWNASGRDKWNSFFTQHRKFGYDIILMAQFDKMLDMQIRSLLEYELIHRKLTNFGLRGWFLSLFFLSFKMHVAVRVWYPLREKVDSDFFKFRRRYAKMYDTFRDFSA